MSFYVSCVGVVKVRSEYWGDLQKFLERRTDFETEEFKKCIEDGLFKIYNDGSFLIPWQWDHEDYKPEWKGKYRTSFKNGVFTYGINVNWRHGNENCWMEFEELLERIGEIIESDGCDEKSLS